MWGGGGEGGEEVNERRGKSKSAGLGLRRVVIWGEVVEVPFRPLLKETFQMVFRSRG